MSPRRPPLFPRVCVCVCMQQFPRGGRRHGERERENEKGGKGGEMGAFRVKGRK